MQVSPIPPPDCVDFRASKEALRHELPRKKVDAIGEAWGIHGPEPFEDFRFQGVDTATAMDLESLLSCFFLNIVTTAGWSTRTFASDSLGALLTSNCNLFAMGNARR